jgi:hypothetical protein
VELALLPNFETNQEQRPVASQPGLSKQRSLDNTVDCMRYNQIAEAQREPLVSVKLVLALALAEMIVEVQAVAGSGPAGMGRKFATMALMAGLVVACYFYNSMLHSSTRCRCCCSSSCFHCWNAVLGTGCWSALGLHPI